MTSLLLSVEQAARELNLHPKTVLRYIHDGRLPATRIGKAYRIARDQLSAFTGVATGRTGTTDGARATCIVDIADVTPEEAQRSASFLQSAALAGNTDAAPLHLETAFDPIGRSLKVVLIGTPIDVGRLLEMLHVQRRGLT